MKRVLVVAYHFPPLAGSSGVQRALRFARHLPEFGWQPIVLTAHPRAYERTGDDQVGDIPEDIEIIRAPAWDSARHFSIAGRYPGFLARPDRWISWWLGAVLNGNAAIRRLKPHAIWSTYPIATAHKIGATLAAGSGLPWIADFRDPMVQPGYPSDVATRLSFDRTEKRAIAEARFSTFTTPSAAKTYRERYPDRAERIVVLENGYDEEAFAETKSAGPLNPGYVTLLHSGIIYRSERDPRQLFAALAAIKSAAPESFARLRVRFRAAVHEALLKELAQLHDVAEAIEVVPPVTYREALTEMLGADGLLILQASNCNEQVPAKLYEYFRAGRPIIALTDPSGDTAGAARRAGIEAIASLDDPDAIQQVLSRFIEQPLAGTLPTEDAVAGASRRGRTEQLAGLLDRAIAGTALHP